MKPAAIISVTAVIAASAPAFAQSGGMQGMDTKGMDMKGMETKGTEKKAVKGTVHKGTGVVKTVDAGNGKVTIAHGPVASIGWPAMTMTFKAKDKAMLDKVQQGAKVEFSFVQSGKDYTITEVK